MTPKFIETFQRFRYSQALQPERITIGCIYIRIYISCTIRKLGCLDRPRFHLNSASLSEVDMMMDVIGSGMTVCSMSVSMVMVRRTERTYKKLIQNSAG